MNRFLSFLSSLLPPQPPKPAPGTPIVVTYGQDSSGFTDEQIQPVMEWVFASLVNAGYTGKAHLFWMQSQGEPKLEKTLKQTLRHAEPILLYRLGDRPPVPPTGYTWRLLPEYAAFRLYQLEVKNLE